MSGERENLLLATLSGGMVGVGDPAGQESKTNLLQAVRPAGVIVKPDTPIVLLDETYMAQARGQRPAMVAAASTSHSGPVAAYVFAYSRREHASKQATFTPASLGIAGNAYVYNYFTGAGALVPAGQSRERPSRRRLILYRRPSRSIRYSFSGRHRHVRFAGSKAHQPPERPWNHSGDRDLCSGRAYDHPLRIRAHPATDQCNERPGRSALL